MDPKIPSYFTDLMSSVFVDMKKYCPWILLNFHRFCWFTWGWPKRFHRVAAFLTLSIQHWGMDRQCSCSSIAISTTACSAAVHEEKQQLLGSIYHILTQMTKAAWMTCLLEVIYFPTSDYTGMLGHWLIFRCFWCWHVKQRKQIIPKHPSWVHTSACLFLILLLADSQMPLICGTMEFLEFTVWLIAIDEEQGSNHEARSMERR